MTQTAAPPTASPPASFDPKLIVSVIDSIRDVFTTMVRTDVTVARPHLKASPAPMYDISGIIGFSGDVSGSIVLSFPSTTASQLVTRFAGIPLEVGSADFPDAVGELANMVAGGAKKTFGVTANITVPSVVMGANHVVARLSGVPCIVLPCTTNLGAFAVEVNIKKSAAAMSKAEGDHI
jgi:chemotaxis protein CheX